MAGLLVRAAEPASAVEAEGPPRASPSAYAPHLWSRRAGRGVGRQQELQLQQRQRLSRGPDPWPAAVWHQCSKGATGGGKRRRLVLPSSSLVLHERRSDPTLFLAHFQVLPLLARRPNQSTHPARRSFPRPVDVALPSPAAALGSSPPDEHQHSAHRSSVVATERPRQLLW